MTRYTIESRAGVLYGVYEGDTPEAAFAAMVADGGGHVGDEHVGTAADWLIRECEPGSDERAPIL